ncbi:MAG: hypothetical protein MUD09_07010 [Desulfobacterales bacterium]|nr:hypothetical protein [Desulfobacterales bacterium]
MGNIPGKKVIDFLRMVFLPSADSSFENAMSLFNKSRYAEAIEEFEKIIQSKPSRR